MQFVRKHWKEEGQRKGAAAAAAAAVRKLNDESFTE